MRGADHALGGGAGGGVVLQADLEAGAHGQRLDQRKLLPGRHHPFVVVELRQTEGARHGNAKADKPLFRLGKDARQVAPDARDQPEDDFDTARGVVGRQVGLGTGEHRADEVDGDGARQVAVDLQADGEGALGHQPVGRRRLTPALPHRFKRDDEAVALQLLDDVRHCLLGELRRPGQVGTRQRSVQPQRVDHDAAVVGARPFLVGAAGGADRADIVHLSFPS